MSVIPIHLPHLAVAPASVEEDTEEDVLVDPVKCGRCRLSFVQHPSVVPGDSTRWWLCPPCRDRLLGQRSRTDARWK